MKLKTLVCLSLLTLVNSLTPASAQTYNVIHAFNGQNGAFPISGVAARAGILYGTTECVNPDKCGAGTAYQLTQVGSNWSFAPISYFSAGGMDPQARIVSGPDNHLYGTTFEGGSLGWGVVFNLGPAVTICKTAACGWVEKILYSFQGTPDGGSPGAGDLVWDTAGNIYGTTREGGAAANVGTVYQMTKSGNGWTEFPIHSFLGPDGASPEAGVILDSNGDLFGTTVEGGLYGFGIIFELTYTTGVGWTQTVLYNFHNLADGKAPLAGLTMDSAGNLYGATTQGGSGRGGTVFELSPVADTWVFTNLYSLSGGGGPDATLAMDNSGNLYGTTERDGNDLAGSVFKLTNTQNGWEYTSLHDFTGESDGAYPTGPVTIDGNGTLYGTASMGGNLQGTCSPSGCGVVWMIKP